jgi:multicomponent K+:H+ antiporter subunit G
MEILISVLLVFGAVFILLGSLGLVKFPDLYARLHAPTKASTLGVGAVLVGSAVYWTQHAEGASVHEVLVTVFFFMTAPISAYLVARAGMHLKVPSDADVPPEE